MGIPENHEERRRFIRYDVADDAYAVIITEKGPLLGEIENISKRGLAFRYEGHDGPVKNVCRVCIFYEEAEFCIEEIPYRKIAEIERRNDEQHDPEFNGVNRRCSMEFGELTMDQENLLEHFIKNHTVQFG